VESEAHLLRRLPRNSTLTPCHCDQPIAIPAAELHGDIREQGLGPELHGNAGGDDYLKVPEIKKPAVASLGWVQLRCSIIPNFYSADPPVRPQYRRGPQRGRRQTEGNSERSRCRRSASLTEENTPEPQLQSLTYSYFDSSRQSSDSPSFQRTPNSYYRRNSDQDLRTVPSFTNELWKG